MTPTVSKPAVAHRVHLTQRPVSLRKRPLQFVLTSDQQASAVYISGLTKRGCLPS